MFKYFFSLLLCILFSGNVFAESVGPNTARYKDFFAQTGACFFKYNDYTATNLFNIGSKKKNSKPSQMGIVAMDKDSSYKSIQFIGNMKGMGRNVQITKNNKIYNLDYLKKEGTVAEKKKDKKKTIIIGNGKMPIALTLLLPDSLKDDSMKGIEKLEKYQGMNKEQYGSKIYECEKYGNSISGFYKLYYLNGELVKFSENGNMGDIIEIKNTFDASILDIPKGFTIYAAEQSDMERLLKQRTVVEQY